MTKAVFDGTVIALQGVMNELRVLDGRRVYAGASVTCAKLARFCAKEDLVGAEFFAGIPGLVGGALAMNAGPVHSLRPPRRHWLVVLDSSDSCVTFTSRPSSYSWEMRAMSCQFMMADSQFAGLKSPSCAGR